MKGFVFHFPWPSSIQTPAFAINYYSHGTLSLSVVQGFNIILGGKQGFEAHNYTGINSFLFFFSLGAPQKAPVRVIAIFVHFKEFLFLFIFSAIVAYSI